MAHTAFGLRGRFWPINRSLFQGARLGGTGNVIAVRTVASSIPTVPLPALPRRRHSNLSNERCRRASGRSAFGAAMARQRRSPPVDKIQWYRSFALVADFSASDLSANGRAVWRQILQPCDLWTPPVCGGK